MGDGGAGPRRLLSAMPGGGLLTDLYGLRMAASYLRRGMTEPATFSLFVRDLPASRGFLVAAGLEDGLAFLQSFGFSDDELGGLAAIGLGEETRGLLAGVRFTGDVRAVGEGRVVLAGEPLLEVTAPLPEAQLVETALLNRLTAQTAVASKAARCALAAAGRIELVEFGFRRAPDVEAGVAAARAAAMVGFVGTSNVLAASRHGLRAVGTMAHSYVEAFTDEASAFAAFADDTDGPVTFLVDTYDAEEGVRRAAEVITSHRLQGRAAIRIDSGDVGSLAALARRQLDRAGLGQVRIFVSGGLDEFSLAELVADGAPVDSAGVGTRLVTPADAPTLDTAYKLVCYAGRPVVKLSEGKATLPGAKQVFRAPGRPDLLALADEATPEGAEPLLEPVMAGGRRLAPAPPLDLLRRRFEHDVATLPASSRRLGDPVAAPVTRSPRLTELDRRARRSSGGAQGWGGAPARRA